MKNGNVMGFRGYRFFSTKSSIAKYSTLGTSGANFGGKNPCMILREVRVDIFIMNKLYFFNQWVASNKTLMYI